MKKIFSLLLVFTALAYQVNATKHTVTISGFAYSPALLSAQIGDTVTISGSTTHPLLQVSKTVWNADGNTALAGGWGTKTVAYTFTVTTSDTIYYVCSAHVTFGMKGRVVVTPSSGINDIPTDQANVSVYPNPLTSKGTIKLTSFGYGQVSVYVYNIAGQMEKDLSSQLTNLNGDYYAKIDASAMPDGNYFVVAADGRNKIVRKFQVIR